MKRSTDNRRSLAEIRSDLQRHYGGLEHSNADMTDFRRPAYPVRYPRKEYVDTLDMSKKEYPYYEYDDTHNMCAAKLIRAQGQQIRRETAWEYLQRRCGLRGDADGQEKTQPVTATEERAGADRQKTGQAV